MIDTAVCVPRAAHLCRLQVHFSVSSCTFSSHSWQFWAQSSKLFKMVPLVTGEARRSFGTFFRESYGFPIIFWPNGDKFQRGTPRILTGSSRSSKQYIYIYCLCLVLFVKTCIFRDCQKCKFKFASFCMQDQLRLGIRIRDHYRTHFDAMNPMAISDFANDLSLKIIFFEVSSIVSICVKLQ